MTNFKFCSTLLLALMTTPSVFSQQPFYSYHPVVAASYQIGYGFDINNPEKAKLICPFKSMEIKEDENVNSQDIYIAVINDQKSLLNAFRLDVSLDARFPKFKIQTTLGISESEIYNENNLTLCLTAIIDFGKDRLEKPKIDDDAKKLIDEKKYDVLFNNYGTHILNAVDRKSMAFIFVTLKNIDKESKKTITASLSAKYGSLFAKVQANANLQKVINESFERNEFDLRSYTVGKFPIQELPDMTKKTLEAFKTKKDFMAASFEVLSTYLKDINDRKKSSVTAYYYTDWTSLNVPKKVYQNMEAKLDKYAELCSYYKQLDSYLSTIDDIETSNKYQSFGSLQAKNLLKSEKIKLRFLKDNISDAMDECNNSSCEKLTECCNIPKGIDLVYDDKNIKLMIKPFFSDPLYEFNQSLFGQNVWHQFGTNAQISPVFISSQISDFIDIPDKNSFFSRDFKLKLLFPKIPEEQKFKVEIFVNGFSLFWDNQIFPANSEQPMIFAANTKLKIQDIGGVVRTFEVKITKISANIEKVQILDDAESYVRLNYQLFPSPISNWSKLMSQFLELKFDRLSPIKAIKD